MRPLPSLATLAAIFVAGTLGKAWLSGGFGNGDAPVSVTKHDETTMRVIGTIDYGYGMKAPHQEALTRKILTITAKAEKVALKKVSLNRGNCTSTQVEALFGAVTEEDWSVRPRVLNFGETAELRADCDVIEVSVDTDQGSFTFNFGR